MSLQIWMSTCWVVEICVCKCFWVERCIFYDASMTSSMTPVWRQYDLHPGGSWQWGSVQGWTATHHASLLQTTWQVLLNFTLFSSKCDFLFDAGSIKVLFCKYSGHAPRCAEWWAMRLFLGCTTVLPSLDLCQLVIRFPNWFEISLSQEFWLKL